MTLKSIMVTTAVSALMAGGAFAQSTSTPTADPAATTEQSIAPTFTSIDEMTVGNIIGKNVYDPNGDTIGDIDYIVGQPGSANAVIGIGGFLGIGEYTVAIPLDDLTYNADAQMVQLDTTKEALKEQPEFDETGVESLPDETQLSTLIASDDPAATAPGADTSVPQAGAATDDPAASDGAATDAAPQDDATSDAPATTEPTSDAATGMTDGTSTDAPAQDGTAADTNADTTVPPATEGAEETDTGSSN